MLLQRRFRQRLPRRPWLEHVQSARPAVLIECHVRADTATDAKTFGSEVIKRLLDMMTLRRDAAARLIAGIVASPNESGRLEIREVWIEHTGYHGNLLGGVIAGEDVHQLQESWNGLQANPRAQLWVSLYADAVRDPRWDYQFFRCFNLLEAIADTAVQPGVVIMDEAGNPRPFRRDKSGSYTTSRHRARSTRCCRTWLERPRTINCGTKSVIGFRFEMTLLTKGRGSRPTRPKHPSTPRRALPSPGAVATARSNLEPKQSLRRSASP